MRTTPTEFYNNTKVWNLENANEYLSMVMEYALLEPEWQISKGQERGKAYYWIENKNTHANLMKWSWSNLSTLMDKLEHETYKFTMEMDAYHA